MGKNLYGPSEQGLSGKKKKKKQQVKSHVGGEKTLRYTRARKLRKSNFHPAMAQEGGSRGKDGSTSGQENFKKKGPLDPKAV